MGGMEGGIMCDEAETIARRDGFIVAYLTEDGWCDTLLGAHMASCDACKLLKRKDLGEENGTG